MSDTSTSALLARVNQHATDGLIFLAEDGGTTRSFDELRRLAAERADWWRAEARRIVFAGRDAFELAAWALAAGAAGGTLLLLPPDQDADRLSEKARALGASHVVGLAEQPPIPAQRRARRLAQGLSALWRRSAAPAVRPFAVLFTSGSEGQPKGVCWSQNAVAAHLQTYERCLTYRPGERLFNALPLHHTDGFFHGPLMALWSGLTLVRPKASFSASALQAWADLAGPAGTDVFVTVPTMLAMLESLPDNPFSQTLRSARLIVSSAEPLPEALGTRVEASLAPVANIYGMTETINGGLFRLAGSGFPVASVGVPVGVEARLSGEGRLELRGAALADGYEVAGRMIPLPRDVEGWWRTNDLARQGDDGSWTILGRADAAVMIGGVTVHPGAVAAAASGLPGVRSAAVTVERSSSALGEPVLVLHLEVAGQEDESQFVQALARTLHGPALPKRIVFHASLPRLASGKVDLQSLRALADGAVVGSGHGQMLADDLDRQIQQIAIATFNLPPGMELSPEMTPEDIPQWDSFGQINFALSIERAFGFRMQFSDLASVGSLSDMRKVVEANR
jgi:acyl-coenzyme A synthetase/AMP-(fatty) acid ligase/acyl carrier protein